jgi:hypothetical protein
MLATAHSARHSAPLCEDLASDSHIRSLLNSLVLLLCIVPVLGCSELRPRVDSEISNKAVAGSVGLPPRYTYVKPDGQNVKADDKSYYLNAYTAQGADQVAVRNSILSDLMSIVDHDFFRFEEDIRSDRAYKDALVTITSIVLTATATAMGGGAAKTLSAIDTGLKGANAAIDKEAFVNQTTVALINQMNADRDSIATAIVNSRTKKIDEYPLETGLQDIGRYFMAGTLTHAIVALGAAAGADAADKKAKLQTATNAK